MKSQWHPYGIHVRILFRISEIHETDEILKDICEILMEIYESLARHPHGIHL